MAGKNSRKITKYPKTINNINIGVVFFAVIAIYIFISVINYLQRDHVVAYQVMEGSISTNNVYDAIALRQEQIVPAETDGYVYYYATEGERVAANKTVYMIDSTGQLLEYLKSQGSEEIALSDEDMSELRSQIIEFDSEQFDEKNFSTVYDFKNSIDVSIQKLSNSSMIENFESLKGSNAVNVVAHDTGIVVYSTDGYEDLTLQTMTGDKFNKEAYQKQRKQLIENSTDNHVYPGDPAYKLCTSEDWSVVIKVDDPKLAEQYLEKEYIKVRFLKNQLESWGAVSTFTNEAGETFVQLSFTNSMITFCKDRFLSIELILDDRPGLKVPNSAIVEKNFFLVPKEYVTKNNDGKTTVLREKYDEQGKMTPESVDVTLYDENETEYYIDMDVLRSGDNLIQLDTNAKYVVSKTASLLGVYNINKGYADFRQINRLEQNKDYSIVESNTMYGLNVYDYIVLDAEAVEAQKEKEAAEKSAVKTAENSGDSGASSDAAGGASENSSAEVSESAEEASSEASESE